VSRILSRIRTTKLLIPPNSSLCWNQIESIEIPDSPPPSQHNVVGEPVIERHPSTDQSHTGQMEIEGLDLNLAGNEEPSTQIDDPIPVSDSDDETSASGETLNNSNSSSNVTSGLKLEPIELGETPLAIVPIIESQSCLALEPPTQESHQVSASLPKSILKKTKRTSRHTIVEPSKKAFNPELHKIVLKNGRFKCFMKECSYGATFKELIRHLRQEHGDAYLVYRYNMLSVYGIMEKQCSDCKYEFLTNESYEHHHQKSRCQIYKNIPIPSDKDQLTIMDEMLETLVPLEI